MKNISTSLHEHLSGEVTTLAFCWKIEYADGTILGFTSHDVDIILEGITYHSKTGFTADRYKNDLTGKNNIFDILGIIDSDHLSENDINSGRLDNADFEVFLVNYKNLSDGKVIIKKGKIARIETSENGYVFGITGLSERLEKNITEIYTPLCRTKFGDSKCKKNLAEFTFEGVVSSVIDERNFIDSTRTESKGYFDKGIIRFTSGANNGFSTLVKRSEITKIYLTIPFPNEILSGDTYVISAGCDKKFSTCKTRYDNALNFRGEPHIPGIDNIFKVL